MRTWLRRIRGAIGMGLLWAGGWFAAGMGLLLVVGPDAADVPFPLGFGALGFLAGISFSLVLVLAEGRRRFEQMSLLRFAAWGAVGGVLFSAIFAMAAGLGGAFPVLGTVFGLAGGGSAAGTRVLARVAEDRGTVGPGAEVDRLPRHRPREGRTAFRSR
jgi:hypothetical protein